MSGPIPKRTEERRRRNKPTSAVASAPASSVVAPPASSDEWHPMAQDWYASLSESGQSKFFEPSDWQQARFAAEVMSRLLGSRAVNGQALSAWLSMSTSLLVTEGDRRRLRIELQRGPAVDPDEDASVTALDAYRAQLEA